MDVDPEPPQDSEDENQRQRTPDAESTADETESDGEEARPPSPPARKTVNKKSGGQTTERYASFPSIMKVSGALGLLKICQSVNILLVGNANPLLGPHLARPRLTLLCQKEICRSGVISQRQ